MQQSAFLPRGNSFNVTTNGTTLTPNAQLVSFNPVIANQVAAQASGVDTCPPQVRVLGGATDVWISFTSVPRVAAIPGPTTPQLETLVKANEDIVFTLPALPTQAGAAAGGASPYTLAVNTIAVGTSVALTIQFGEGI